MRVIHVLRKPCSEKTVASNVLKHGTGGLNIDASRIGTTDHFGGGAKMSSSGHTLSKFDPYEKGSGWVAGSVSGRWPANVVLQHLDGCRCDGVKTAGSGRFVAHDAVVRKSTMMDPDKGWNGNSLDNSKKSAPNSYGQETVANWICEPGCPVARLDEQSGVSTSTGGTRRAGRFAGLYGAFSGENPGSSAGGLGDTGGASRFYKQVGGKVDG